MELRNTEQELNDMLIVYESLYRCDHQTGLPALELPPVHQQVLDANTTSFTTFATPEDALQALQSLHAKFFSSDLETRRKKFEQRLADKDPITGAPRYGEKTATRVQNVLELHGLLKQATWAAFGLELETEEGDNEDAVNNITGAGANNSVVANLQSAIEAKQEATRQAELKKQQQAKAAEAERLAQEERQRQEEERQRQEAEEARRQEEAELNRAANEAREATRRAQEAAAQAEQDWINSIPKGPGGVRTQIQILKDDTQDDPATQKTALTSLLTIFTQIAQHPEEINFRRIRRDHPQFHQDIGRFKGGREVLIAAGFQLTTLDDVPVFFSKEPDLESDMDGWSLWFDNLKANLEVVKEMQ